MSPKKKNQWEVIISAMQGQPDRKWIVSDFQKSEQFVGYKCSTRISELIQHGYIETAGKSGRFTLYKITKKGMKAETIYALMRKEKHALIRAFEWLFG